MTNVTIDAGTLLFAAEDDMLATGLLVPYGVECRSNLGAFTVEPGVFDIPADVTGLGVNIEHEREEVVGGFERVWEQPEAGILFAMRFANTPKGIKARDEARSGARRNLSVEASGVRIRNGRAVSGAVFGGALVEAPAFPGATLLAAAPDTDEVDDEETEETTPPADSDGTDSETAGDGTETVVSQSSSASAYEDGSEWADSSVTTEETETLPDGRTRIIRTTITTTETTEPTGAEESIIEGTGILTANATPGTVPATLLASGSAPESPATTEPREPDARTLFASFARVRAGLATVEDTTLLAAFSNITMAGGGAAQLPASGVLRPAWLGEVYNGIPYVREYIGLHKLGTEITAGGKSGFQIGRGANEGAETDHLDGAWSGNLTDLKSGQGFTKPINSTLAKFAIGNKLGREFFDLPGGAETIDAWFRLIAEDHLYWSDMGALQTIIATAGANTVAPATAKYSTAYPTAAGMLIQGILAVKRRKADGRKDVPTYAIANELAFEELAYAAGGEENLPAFVSLVVTTASEGTVDGNVQVVEGETGIEDTESVIVGAREAIDFDELPGGPLTVDALDLAKGGVDRAVHGYLQTFVKRPEALVRVGVADV